MAHKISSTAEYYHEQTKYRVDSLSGPGLDWESKPEVFKEYPGAETVRLDDRLPFSSSKPVSLRALPSAQGDMTLEALARILFFTNGITGVLQQPGDYHFYRAAPSAGALYPTELYLAVRNQPDLQSGIYSFHVRNHQLVRTAPIGFAPADDELFDVLSRASLGHPAVAASDVCFLLSTVFYRSAWRYGPRAYRRCMLDTGHVLGNLLAYLPLEGFTAYPTTAFVDQEVNDVLSLDSSQEGVCALVPVLPADRDPMLGSSYAVGRSTPFGSFDRVGDDALLDNIAKRSEITRDSTALTRVVSDSSGSGKYRASKLKFQPGKQLDQPPPDLREELPEAILRRRSTRQFSGNAISREQLGEMLEYAYRYDLVGSESEAPRFFDLSLLETWVVVHRVSGMQAGVYYYSSDDRELKLVYKGDFRQQTHYLSLSQDLASDAAAVVIHTCDLPLAVERYGDRAYRMMHLDAGHIGERLNLCAVSMELGASGIGGFLDEEVNSMLYIPDREACVYVTCLGEPAL